MDHEVGHQAIYLVARDAAVENKRKENPLAREHLSMQEGAMSQARPLLIIIIIIIINIHGYILSIVVYA